MGNMTLLCEQFFPSELASIRGRGNQWGLYSNLSDKTFDDEEEEEED